MSTINSWLAAPPDNYSQTITETSLSAVALSFTPNSVSGLPQEGVGVLFQKDANGAVDATTVEFVHWTSVAGGIVNLSDTGDRGLTGSYNGAQAHTGTIYFEVWVTGQYYYGKSRDGFVAEHSAAGVHDTTKVVDLATAQSLTNKTLGTGTKIVLGSDAVGDIYYTAASNVLTRLAASTSGYVLTANGAGVAPSWQVATGIPTTGWIDDTAETWTYASASTFTVSGDQTAKYTVGTKLKFTQTTVKYAVVLSSSYGAPNTTVTILVNTSYTIANAAISANNHSYVTNPQGWPGWFALAAPTFNVSGAGGIDNGSGGQPTISETRINIDGRTVRIHLRGGGYKVTTDYYFYTTVNGFPAPTNTTEQTIIGVGNATAGTSEWLLTIKHISGIANLYFLTATGATIANDQQFQSFSANITYEI
jgi:hypothetical protein